METRFNFTSREECPYCGYLHFECFVLHNGSSVRQDCVRCRKTFKFCWWYEKSRPISLMPIVDKLKNLKSEKDKMQLIRDYVSLRLPVPEDWKFDLTVDRKKGLASCLKTGEYNEN